MLGVTDFQVNVYSAPTAKTGIGVERHRLRNNPLGRFVLAPDLSGMTNQELTMNLQLVMWIGRLGCFDSDALRVMARGRESSQRGTWTLHWFGKFGASR
jgi:hypothetical protein